MLPTHTGQGFIGQGFIGQGFIGQGFIGQGFIGQGFIGRRDARPTLPAPNPSYLLRRSYSYPTRHTAAERSRVLLGTLSPVLLMLCSNSSRTQ